MRKEITAKAFVFGKNIDTDQIYPGRYLELVDPKEIATHCLEGADPTFAEKMSPRDIVVAGTNFGCGSSREHAAITLLNAGVSVVLAESFARIFFRNAINLALPLMVCPGISEKVKDGDQLEVNLEEGTVFNKTTGETLQGEKISDYTMNILENGGIKPLFKKKTAQMYK
ncbi:3-isopropylmalate dehydratase small subunit [Irregularibacter muris]|uniref:3-isopropylmalate dehydratase small subunit n=1 Tax=Irregularibacter muris TaxID=1796619 RepID=A0AAE3HH72_9FIRM|nr:3-isopropylmalate dehydratase small subunit [Irregularibacter muris]MCR1899053.1 3-isopropylmalate dehydratase small subunit [Irregularibacter muris]